MPIPDVIFEHRLYLPLIGVCLSFPGFVALLSNLICYKFNIRIAPAASATALLIVLTVLTVMRNQVWRHEVRLFSDVVEKSPSEGSRL